MKKLRSQKVVIDLPTEEAVPWVQATLQTVIKSEDGSTRQVIDRTGFCNRSLNDFAGQIVSIVDPVTGGKVTVSGAGLATLVRDFILVWIQQDYGGTVQPNGDLIVEE